MRAARVLWLAAALCLTLWPALATAEPPAPAGDLVYSDDFSDPTRSGLEDNLRATDYGRGFHAPGVYHLQLYRNDVTYWSMFPGLRHADFSLELDMWDNSDSLAGDAAQGVIFRAQDASHFYAVLVDPRKGDYAVRKLSGDDGWSDIVAWEASPLVQRQSQINRLRVDAARDDFTIYLNGEQLATFSDSSYAGGGFGLLAMNVDATQPHMHYDNLEVYSTEQPQAGLPRTAETPGPADALPLVALGLALLGAGATLRAGRRA
jgi:hypothetical protein